MAYRELPKLAATTVRMIKRCCGRESNSKETQISPRVLFQAENVSLSLMELVIAIQSFRRLRRGGFFRDNPDDEDRHGKILLREAIRNYEEDVGRIGRITARAIETADSAFSEHLAFAISFSEDFAHLRRYEVVRALYFLGWQSLGPTPILDRILERVREVLGPDVDRQGIKDDLKALKIDYKRAKRGAPKKR
jgi:hypothetical protein